MRKTVDVIMMSPLNSIIGPVQTIKRIKRNHDFFLKEGYDISFFTADDLSKTVVDKIRDTPLDIVIKLKVFLQYLSLNSRLYSIFRIYMTFRDSKRLLKHYISIDRNSDVLVFHSIYDCYVYMKYYRRVNSKIALFTHSDGLLFEQELIYFPKLKGGLIEKKLMKMADYVMHNVDIKPCIAKIEEKNLLFTYPQLKGKTCLVVNAIDDLSNEEKHTADLIRGEYSAPKYRLICSGSIQGRKGQRIIIEAIHLLNASLLKDIHLTFIGDGPERPSLEALVLEYSLSEYVEFKGSIPNLDVYKELARANIFILMSYNEGLPIALIEALRSGLAIIATNISGIPELVNENINGKLLNPDVGELLALLNCINGYNWNEMCNNSRKLFEEYYEFTRMRSDYLNMLNIVTK